MYPASYYWRTALDVFAAGESVPARVRDVPTLRGDAPAVGRHQSFDVLFPGRRQRRESSHLAGHDAVARFVDGIEGVTEPGLGPKSEGGEKGPGEGDGDGDPGGDGDVDSDEESERRARRARRRERRAAKARKKREAEERLESMEHEQEDWRMAIAWGRTLVCLAHESATGDGPPSSEIEDEGGEAGRVHALLRDFEGLFPGLFPTPFSSSLLMLRQPAPAQTQEPRTSLSHAAHPPTPSPTASSASPSPVPTALPIPVAVPLPTIPTFVPCPITVPVPRASTALPTVSAFSVGEDAHALLVRAMDQFARGVLYMPRVAWSTRPFPVVGEKREEGFAGKGDEKESEETGVGSTGTARSFSSPGLSTYPSSHDSEQSSTYYATLLSPLSRLPSRPDVLLALASSVLGVAARLPRAPDRAYWGRWADGIVGVVGVSLGRGGGGVGVGLFNFGALEGSTSGPAGIGVESGLSVGEGEDTELLVRVDICRARCWLMIGYALVEGLPPEVLLGDREGGGDVRDTGIWGRSEKEEVEDCKEALEKGWFFRLHPFLLLTTRAPDCPRY